MFYALLTDPDNELINGPLEVIDAFGGPQEINRRASGVTGKCELMVAV